jgi:hypothetical protein
VLLSNAIGAIAAGFIFAGMAIGMSHAFMVPCLTLPFCVVATICHVLLNGGEVRGCVAAKVPVSPEANYSAHMKELKQIEAEMDSRSRARQHFRANSNLDNYTTSETDSFVAYRPQGRASPTVMEVSVGKDEYRGEFAVEIPQIDQKLVEEQPQFHQEDSFSITSHRSTALQPVSAPLSPLHRYKRSLSHPNADPWISLPFPRRSKSSLKIGSVV